MVLEKKMEALKQEEEEEFDLDQNQRSAIIKGKRTKRPRQSSPPFLVSSAATSSSNSTAVNYYSVSSPTTSGAEIISTTSSEDEDMAANCLILLAQGIHYQEKSPENKNLTGATGGSDAYECKTCNRTFQSFQALGGHRASHKKPKITTQDKPAMAPVITALKNLAHDHDHDQDKEREKMRIIMNNSTKVHECSICGAEFSSGQALGGHMRRHRAPPPPPVLKGQMMNYSNEEEDHEKKNGNLLGLDLNLPAPIEDDNNKFQFLSSNMVFSGPTLVYCHY